MTDLGGYTLKAQKKKIQTTNKFISLLKSSIFKDALISIFNKLKQMHDDSIYFKRKIPISHIEGLISVSPRSSLIPSFNCIVLLLSCGEYHCKWEEYSQVPIYKFATENILQNNTFQITYAGPHLIAWTMHKNFPSLCLPLVLL